MAGESFMLGLTGATAHPLSFVRHRANWTTNFWAPPRSGSYETDCAAGRAAAREMIQFIRENRCPAIYASICRDMQSAGIWDGFEVGFCTEIGITVLV